LAELPGVAMFEVGDPALEALPYAIVRHFSRSIIDLKLSQSLPPKLKIVVTNAEPIALSK
jgi:hypothetical protein